MKLLLLEELAPSGGSGAADSVSREHDFSSHIQFKEIVVRTIALFALLISECFWLQIWDLSVY
ncbi:hypothetical protein [Mesobacillus subterraneus]|uniref:Uncharacterized protein n=1 Tax=Mesobacillus subterraneus TaxID=285983 RepID=A0A3R9DVS9_9BACI|nr:hypothetical protein [Mesobacillus subterraneus]RSD28502.1 hypothetical protein EJA10_05320 [Mesobacillus subterraneus]